MYILSVAVKIVKKGIIPQLLSLYGKAIITIIIFDKSITNLTLNGPQPDTIMSIDAIRLGS